VRPTEDGVAIRLRRLGGEVGARAGRGVTLLDALLAAGASVPHRCREARCGRCRVWVAAGAPALAPPGEAERRRLGAAAATGARLMCQARVAAPEAAHEVVVEA
jgi:ferredoxin